MTVKVRYSGLARAAAGKAAEDFALAPGADLNSLLAEISRRHGTTMQALLATTERGLPAALIFIANEQISTHTPITLKDHDDVMILSPISGG